VGGRGGGGGGPPPGGSASLVADVRLVEVLGSEQHVYFSVDATPVGSAVAESTEAGILAVDAPNGVARVDPRVAVRSGERVTFGVDPARLHFFDPDTGSAISG
jgi:multiple sugar transport system ATP-binding protein